MGRGQGLQKKRQKIRPRILSNTSKLLKGVMYQLLGAGCKVSLFLGRGPCFQWKSLIFLIQEPSPALKSWWLADCVKIDLVGTLEPKNCMLLRFYWIISHSIKSRLFAIHRSSLVIYSFALLGLDVSDMDGPTICHAGPAYWNINRYNRLPESEEIPCLVEPWISGIFSPGWASLVGAAVRGELRVSGSNDWWAYRTKASRAAEGGH